jgi:hypothetical protein
MAESGGVRHFSSFLAHVTLPESVGECKVLKLQCQVMWSGVDSIWNPGGIGQ